MYCKHMEKRGRKPFIGIEKIKPQPPLWWKDEIPYGHEPAFQGTSVPFWDKDINSWVLVVHNTIDKSHMLYNFSKKSLSNVIYTPFQN